MRGVLSVFGVATAAALLAFPGVAQAAGHQPYLDVPASFWANTSINWSVKQGWMTPRSTSRFGIAHTASRLTAARVLAELDQTVNATPVAADPYTQAVTAGWMGPGTGADGTITQLQFDKGVVDILGLTSTAKTLSTLHTSNGWRPPLSVGFGVEQTVRALGARVNAPEGFDQWEMWPSNMLLRADLAAEAYQLGHLSPWAVSAAEAKTAVVTAMPKWTPLKRAVLGFALKYAGAPYIWGGTSPQKQVEFGQNVAGGFDCSGFVWWVMKLQTYTAGGNTWSGANAIGELRTTYQMSQSVKLKNRIPRADLHPGDILFWSSAPEGVHTSWTTIYHTGIYLGNGWTINSHGSGDGVTLDYMGPDAGWYHDAFAFGWRIMPMHK
ncbi:MAG TPA: NlpC/P60 family protein [Gaiellales bacterium]